MEHYSDKNGTELGTTGRADPAPGKTCIAYYLGMIPYEPALRLQETLSLARARRTVSDVLLLLQHAAVFTIGRFKGEADIVVSDETLTREGIAVFHTNRGGGVTYHGPGQLVGYPILSLRENNLGVREYVGKLEDAILRLLRSLDIRGYLDPNYPGVWVGGEKVCSIGIHVSRGVTMHGFALNVNTDLRHFEYIHPCGLSDKAMTSISKILGRPVEAEAIIGPLLDAFSAVFSLKIERGDDKCLPMTGGLSG
ncbi:MAG: lipoyl(octanoyl) transferase LipB [Dehalococcoidia bacterium]